MNKREKSGGIGFFGLLGIAFIVLKLIKVIDWSWWWVLAPIWAPLSIGVLLIAIGAIGTAIVDKKKGA